MDSDDVDISQVIPSLHISVSQLNVRQTRSLLDRLGTGEARERVMKDNSYLLHTLIATSSRDEKRGTAIVYMLVDAGIDVNFKDPATQESPLSHAIQLGNVAVADALLQCGSDPVEPFMGETIFSQLNAPGDTKLLRNLKRFQKLFQKHGEGLWGNVAGGRVNGVRAAINSWCKTKLQQNGKTLKELALDTGCDYITTLLFSVDPFMTLVHHVLAQDVPSIRKWYQGRTTKDNIYIFKWEPWGKTNLLQCAIQYQNCELIGELRAHGERLSTIVGHRTEGDIPVFFTALESSTKVDVVETLLKDTSAYKERIETLFAADHNALQFAIKNNCTEDIISTLIRHGGPVLLTARNCANLQARDLAERLNRRCYVKMIDHFVAEWIAHPEDHPSHFRTTMALHCYDLENILRNVSECDEVAKFLSFYADVQERILRLLDALENNDESQFLNNLIFEDPSFGRFNLALEGRLPGIGLPLLHLAVLHNSTSLLRIITQPESNINNVDLDSVRDQFQKTALHYAYALTDGRELIRILFSAGCSESVFDMYGRRPEDYREVRGSDEMTTLLERLRRHDYTRPFEDPLDPECVARYRDLQRRQRISSFLSGQSPYGHCHNQHSLACYHLSNWGAPLKSGNNRYGGLWCSLL